MQIFFLLSRFNSVSTRYPSTTIQLKKLLWFEESALAQSTDWQSRSDSLNQWEESSSYSVDSIGKQNSVFLLSNWRKGYWKPKASCNSVLAEGKVKLVQHWRLVHHLSNHWFCFGYLTAEVCLDKYTRKVIKTLWTLLQTYTRRYNKTRDVLFAIAERQQWSDTQSIWLLRPLPAIAIVLLARFACTTPA